MSEAMPARLKEHIRKYDLPSSPGSRAILLSDAGETRAHTISPQPRASLSCLFLHLRASLRIPKHDRVHTWLRDFALIHTHHLLSSQSSVRRPQLLREAFLTTLLKIANDSSPNLTPLFPLLFCINPNTHLTYYICYFFILCIPCRPHCNARPAVCPGKARGLSFLKNDCIPGTSSSICRRVGTR